MYAQEIKQMLEALRMGQRLGWDAGICTWDDKWEFTDPQSSSLGSWENSGILRNKEVRRSSYLWECKVKDRAIFIF